MCDVFPELVAGGGTKCGVEAGTKSDKLCSTRVDSCKVRATGKFVRCCTAYVVSCRSQNASTPLAVPSLEGVAVHSAPRSLERGNPHIQEYKINIHTQK